MLDAPKRWKNATVPELGIVDQGALNAPTLVADDHGPHPSPIWCRSSPKSIMPYMRRADPRLTSGMRQSEMTRSDQAANAPDRSGGWMERLVQVASQTDNVYRSFAGLPPRGLDGLAGREAGRTSPQLAGKNFPLFTVCTPCIQLRIPVLGGCRRGRGGAGARSARAPSEGSPSDGFAH